MAKSYKFIGGEWDGRYYDLDSAPPEYRVFARSRINLAAPPLPSDLPPSFTEPPIDEYVKRALPNGPTVYVLKQLALTRVFDYLTLDL